MSVAGDTAYLASGLVERIEANAILGFTDGLVIGNLVRQSYQQSADQISFQVYNRGTHKLTSGDPGAVTDGTIISLSEFGSAKKTITLAPYAVSSPVYYDTIFSSVANPAPIVGQFLGNSMASSVDLAIGALFDDFNSGNDVGTSTVAITVDNLFDAVTKLGDNYAPAPWRCVLDPKQITGTYGLSNDLVTSNQFGGSPGLQDEMLRNGFVQMIAGLPVYQSRELPSDSTTEHWGCAFSEQAIGYGWAGSPQGIFMTMDDEPRYQRYTYLANHFYGVIELDDYWGAGIHTATSA